ncbi:MAG TPA: thioesterase family protein [Xanthobacteraceae bacterium]|nr:thioesterase family protein [Xanthobacteraceae bacterium]
MLTNTRSTRIEWSDCDPLGIIFYPRYFQIFEISTTVLIERALGVSKSEYLKTYDFAGHPLLETGARFRLPTRFGDELTIESALVACGRSSFKVEHRIIRAGVLAVEGFETRVWVVHDPDVPARMRPHPMPPEVLARFMPS